MDKVLYLQLIRDKKIGGDTREVQLLQVDVVKNIATVPKERGTNTIDKMIVSKSGHPIPPRFFSNTSPQTNPDQPKADPALHPLD